MVEAAPIPTDSCIRYFTRDRDAFGFLSHFHLSPIDLDGEIWATVEHFYQAQKSDRPDYRAAIRAAETPGLAKRLAAQPTAPKRARQKSWFRKNGVAPRADWHNAKLDIMRRADFTKFSQHSDLAALLLATGEALLIEDSPSEPFWGTGSDGEGQNWAGRVIMEVRDRLRGKRSTLLS
jgi:N-glycosidase YbiA